jgi:hypothetical protein
MRPVTIVEELRPDIQDRVRSRFAREAEALRALGFRDLGYYGELLGNYSLFTRLPTLFFMRLKHEVIWRHPRLQAGASFLLLHHSQPDTIALPMGLGVKFYTGFADDTLVVTTSFPGVPTRGPNRPVLKESANGSIEEAWHAHCRRVEGRSTNRAIRPNNSFGAFVVMARQEEAAVQGW